MKRKRPPAPRSRAGLIFKIVCVYYATLAGFIACAVFAGPGTGGEFPARWETVLAGLYYLVPVFIACVFGFFFRPFWKSFRDLLASIVLVHLFYSAVILGWRQAHLSGRQALISESLLAAVHADFFGHRLLDNDQDGLIDEVALWGRLDIGGLPPGRYISGIVLSQDGAPVSQGMADRRGLRKTDQKKADVRFRFDPREYRRSFERPVGIDLYLYRLVEVDEEAGRIMSFSRWMPFFKTTSWRGQDRDFYPDMVLIEVIYGAASVELLPF